MNKKLLSVAVIAALALPLTANAGTSKAYGKVHLALQGVTAGDASRVWDIDGESRKASKFGIKGSVDTNLMDFKAVYQLEMGLDMNKASDGQGYLGYYERDTWTGMSSKTMGTVRGGTIISAWKSTSKLVDPMFTTAFEGRGKIVGGASSQLAGGTGDNRGRSTRTIRYDSPKIAGVKVSANYAFRDAADAMGVGVLYKAGGIAAFANYQTINADESATKFGGKISMGAFGLSGAYEIDSGAISTNGKDGTQNSLYAAATYSMGATTFVANLGQVAESLKDAADDSLGYGFTVKQKVAKKVSIYAGYGASSGGTEYEDRTAIIVGMNSNF